MKFAYADPPYLGQAKKHYNHDDRCCEVNHEILINTMTDHYDGWALSCSSPSLQHILPLCPPKTRVMAWVKPFAVYNDFGINRTALFDLTVGTPHLTVLYEGCPIYTESSLVFKVNVNPAYAWEPVLVYNLSIIH